MAPKRYTIYSTPTLDRVLAARITETENGFRSRSSMISAIADRYAEICRRSLPKLQANHWLLIFDSLNGCWLLDNAAMAAQSIPLEVSDHISLNAAAATWNLTDEQAQALVARLASASFAELVSIIDAAERFWTMDIQPEKGKWEPALTKILGQSAIDPTEKNNVQS